MRWRRSHERRERRLTWLGILGVVVVVTALAALTGIKPKGTEHLAHTRMMNAARFALLVLVLILGVAYALGRTHAHG